MKGQKNLQTENQLLGINESGIIESDEEGRARSGGEFDNYNSAAKLLSERKSEVKMETSSNQQVKSKDSIKQEPVEFQNLKQPPKQPKLIEPVSSFARSDGMGQSKSGWWNLVKKENQNDDISVKRTDNERLKNRAVTNKGAFESVIVDNEDGELPNQYEAPMSKTAQQFFREGYQPEQSSSKAFSEMKKMSQIDQETEPGDGEDEQLFGDFRFKSFRKHKLVQEDYSLLTINDPEEQDDIKAKAMFPEDKLVKQSIELVGINHSQLVEQERIEKLREQQRERRQMEVIKQEVKFIKEQEKATSKHLVKREKELEKLIELKQARSKQEFEIKQKVLKETFGSSVKSLIKQVGRQKEIITQSYGPIVLSSKQSEEPLFKINPDLDPDGAKWQADLARHQQSIPQTMLVKLKTVRCLKDKVASGHFLVIVHALDRIGGNRIMFDYQRTEEQYRVLSKNLRDLAIKKREYLNKTNRTQEVKNKDGETKFVEAAATGIGFFKSQLPNHNDDESQDLEQQPADSSTILETPIDYKKDLLIDMERVYSRYVRFNGKCNDDNLDIEDTVSVLIPVAPESTNVLLFQLVLLESETIPKDYTVGWGVFPMLNSDFGLNEGKFKVPLLFGEVDPDIDKFMKIEDYMKEDLDHWLANLYFELEKVNLMDIKVEGSTNRLFYKPVAGISPQEQQQLLKMHQNDVLEFGDDPDAGVEGGIIQDDNIDDGLDSNQDDGSSSDSDFSDATEKDTEKDAVKVAKQADDFAQKFVELQYDRERTWEDINYDHYHFAVGQKYDLTNRNLSFKKFKYIADEVFLDLRWRQRKTIQFQTTLLMIVALFYLRIFIHYTGQYTVLVIMQVPVTQYLPSWTRVGITYAAWELYQECVMIITGAMANTAVFGLLTLVSIVCMKMWNWFPKMWYSVICWVGIFTVADPFLTLLFDIIAQDWNGDMFKLYNWFSKTEDSGVVGIYITLFFVLFETSVSGYAYYRFMVHRYMNGRILDLYRRLSGQYKAFFIPLDNEISLKYLQWVINRAKKRDYVILSERRTIKDKFGIDRMVNFVQLLKVHKGLLFKNRLFFKDFDGSLIEVPQSKVALNTLDLKKVKMQKRDNNANAYGTHNKTLHELIEQSYSMIKGSGAEVEENYYGSLAGLKKMQADQKKESEVPILIDGDFTRTKVVVEQPAFDNNEDEINLL